MSLFHIYFKNYRKYTIANFIANAITIAVTNFPKQDKRGGVRQVDMVFKLNGDGEAMGNGDEVIKTTCAIILHQSVSFLKAEHGFHTTLSLTIDPVHRCSGSRIPSWL
jgi:hypothetical protein